MDSLRTPDIQPVGGSATPLLRSNIDHRLGEHPAVTTEVFDSVLALTVWVSLRWMEDTCTALVYVCIVMIDILDMYAYGVSYFLGVGWSKHGPVVPIGGLT
jgi:hypothetical protein